MQNDRCTGDKHIICTIKLVISNYTTNNYLLYKYQYIYYYIGTGTIVVLYICLYICV